MAESKRAIEETGAGEKPRKAGRGGARKNAGRKKADLPCAFIIRTSQLALDNIDRLAVYTGKSRQRLIREWAENLDVPEEAPLPVRRTRVRSTNGARSKEKE